MNAREPSADRPSYEELERRVAELEAEVKKLKGLLEEALRAGKRQAAPFRKEPPGEPLGKAKRREKKKPGRKSGEEHGDLRRHDGRCYAHGPSQKGFDAHASRLAQKWLRRTRRQSASRCSRPASPSC